MANYFIRFIPENIELSLNESKINLIRNLKWKGHRPQVISNDVIKFADAGQNFETVKCPFCCVDIMEWWGSAMDDAYSGNKGFVNLDVTMPCCASKTSLHTLDYNFPQGFYKAMVEINATVDDLDANEISQNLLSITREKWRVVHSRY